MVSSLMNSYYAETGVPIVGVQASRGGTNIGYWNTAAQKNEHSRDLPPLNPILKITVIL